MHDCIGFRSSKEILFKSLGFRIHCVLYLHSPLNDTEIPGTKCFIPKRFELATTLSLIADLFYETSYSIFPFSLFKLADQWAIDGPGP